MDTSWNRGVLVVVLDIQLWTIYHLLFLEITTAGIMYLLARHCASGDEVPSSHVVW